jgi:hypothetical protein
MTVASPSGRGNVDGDRRRLVLEYIRATPGILKGLAALLVALASLITVLIR